MSLKQKILDKISLTNRNAVRQMAQHIQRIVEPTHAQEGEQRGREDYIIDAEKVLR